MSTLFTSDELEAQLDQCEAELEQKFAAAGDSPAAMSEALDAAAEYLETAPPQEVAVLEAVVSSEAPTASVQEPAPIVWSTAIEEKSLAEKLREQTSAVAFSQSRFGVRRAFDHDENTKVAEEFGAQVDAVGGSKKLVNTRHEKYKAVTEVMGRAKRYWLAVSVPYPKDGVRLIRTDRVDQFNDAMQEFRTQLAATAAELDEEYKSNLATMNAAGQPPEDGVIRRLGSLHDPSYYPDSIKGCFRIDWEFPSIAPDARLATLNPELYEAECQKIKDRFEQAVKLTEEAFTQRFASLVAGMVDNLTPAPEGTKKSFQSCHMENLKTFFEQFKELNIGGNAALEGLIETAKNAVDGVETDGLKKDALGRKTVLEAFQAIEEQLSGMLVEAPKRRIRRGKAENAETAGETQETAAGEQGEPAETPEQEAANAVS